MFQDVRHQVHVSVTTSLQDQALLARSNQMGLQGRIRGQCLLETVLPLVNMKVKLFFSFRVKIAIFLGSPTSGNPYYYYELFWNSAVVVDTANSIIQMNQITNESKV